MKVIRKKLKKKLKKLSKLDMCYWFSLLKKQDLIDREEKKHNRGYAFVDGRRDLLKQLIYFLFPYRNQNYIHLVKLQQELNQKIVF